jgi:hypothetical protein
MRLLFLRGGAVKGHRQAKYGQAGYGPAVTAKPATSAVFLGSGDIGPPRIRLQILSHGRYPGTATE